MSLLLLVLIPAVFAVAAFALNDNERRPWLIPTGAAVHAALTTFLLRFDPGPALGGALALDAQGRIVLGLLSVLFFGSSVYAVGYLKVHPERDNRTFTACLLAFLAATSLASLSQHFGLLWVAVEATTLSAAPLLYFKHNARSLEATWKYLVIGSVGIALALLGTFFLATAETAGGPVTDVLLFPAMLARGGSLSVPWLRIAVVFLIVGYGTKMGVAPLHTWKPDAYGEAPGIVGAMLAGGVTTVAFTAILRVRAVINAAGEGAMADHTLLAIGIFSMLVAALFLLVTRDFKRMLAYSSVEHMGILSIGAALGGAGLWAALFHVWNNSLTKGALFLSAGNIRRAAGARTVDEVAGMAIRTPVSARIFVTGLLAVTACPPFGPFFSELRIVRTAFATGHAAVAAGFLGCLLFAFFGLTRLVFAIVDGRPRPAARATGPRLRETAGTVLPPLALLGASLWLGLATPSVLQETWTAAVQALLPTP